MFQNNLVLYLKGTSLTGKLRRAENIVYCDPEHSQVLLLGMLLGTVCLDST